MSENMKPYAETEAGLIDAHRDRHRDLQPHTLLDGEWSYAGEACSECGWRAGVHVDCDSNCLALIEPETPDEIKAAYEHWREHGYLSGCSHAR